MVVKGPAQICEKAWTAGVPGTDVEGQVLVLESAKGIIVITGCAHPGIVRFAKEHFCQKITLAYGAFPLSRPTGSV